MNKIRQNTLILSAGLILSTSCSTHKENNEKRENEFKQAFLENVKTATVYSAGCETELLLAGKVEYDPDRVISYIPLIKGLTTRTYFSLGDKVQKGQTLMDVRSSDLSALFSEYVTLEAELEVADRALQNAQSMHDDHMLSDKELLEAKARAKQAKASFERVANDLSPYKKCADGIFSILAPMSGYIVDKQVASGSPISSEGSPLFVIADLSKVWITANVYASDLTLVHEKMPAEITTPAYPTEIFKGKIDILSQVFDPEERVLKARIMMPNDDMKFKPEMSVSIKLKSSKSASRFAIPSSALIFNDNKYFVVLEEDKGKYRSREVTPNGNYANTTYISEGLTENDKVVVEGQLLIYESLSGK